MGRKLSPNPNQEQPQEPRNKPTNTNGRRRRRTIRTPTLGTNPQTPTHGRNHTHFKNKPINRKNGFGSGRERWAEFGPPPMVAMMVGGRAKEALPWNFKEHRRGFVVFYWSGFVVSMLICLLLCDLGLLLSSLLIFTTQVFGFLSSLLISTTRDSCFWISWFSFVELESSRLDFHIDFQRNWVFDTCVAIVNSTLRNSRC